MKLEKNMGKKNVIKKEILSCVDHQFCFCKECVILDGSRSTGSNERSGNGNSKSDQTPEIQYKISCGSMVRG